MTRDAIVTTHDKMVHYPDSEEAPTRTLCGISLDDQIVCMSRRDVDCMACAAREREPTFAERIASVMNIPIEYLFGRK